VLNRDLPAEISRGVGANTELPLGQKVVLSACPFEPRDKRMHAAGCRRAFEDPFRHNTSYIPVLDNIHTPIANFRTNRRR
jgi:hypothetical protein